MDDRNKPGAVVFESELNKIIPGKPAIPHELKSIAQSGEFELRKGTTQFCRKELTALDAIDIITKSLKCGKLNNSTRIKIIDNVVKELKAFYD